MFLVQLFELELIAKLGIFLQIKKILKKFKLISAIISSKRYDNCNIGHFP